ncbi:MAG: type II secretion system protein [Patescibacteria group bacterium]
MKTGTEKTEYNRRGGFTPHSTTPVFRNELRWVFRLNRRSARHTRLSEGFTLIEMLVVVAVIGILSSVLLTSLGPARDKAKDSRILTEVNQARALGEVTSNGGVYVGLGANDTERGAIVDERLLTLAEDIANQGGLLNLRVSQDERAFLVYSPLNLKVGQGATEQINYYCVDSVGKAGFYADLPSLLTIIPTDAASHRCP